MYPHCDLPIICHPHLSPNVHCSHYLTKSLKYNVNHLHCDLPMIFHPHFMPSKVQISENHLVDMLFSPSIYYQPHLSPKYKKCKFTHLIFFFRKRKIFSSRFRRYKLSCINGRIKWQRRWHTKQNLSDSTKNNVRNWNTGM